MPKAMSPSSPKLPQLGTLGTKREGHEMSTPARPIKESASTNMICCFKNTCVLILVINLTYYVMHAAYKYRLNHENWNKTIQCLFLNMV